MYEYSLPISSSPILSQQYGYVDNTTKQAVFLFWDRLFFMPGGFRSRNTYKNRHLFIFIGASDAFRAP
jgi:hypothetical protein